MSVKEPFRQRRSSSALVSNPGQQTGSAVYTQGRHMALHFKGKLLLDQLAAVEQGAGASLAVRRG